MKWLITILMLAIFTATCIANTALPDRSNTFMNTTNGLTSTFELQNAVSRHVFVAFFGGSQVNQTNTLNVNTPISCTNSSYAIGVCSTNLTKLDGFNWTILRNSSVSTAYNVTINITNSSLGASGTVFNLSIYGAFINKNLSNNATIDIWNGTVWVNLGKMEPNSTQWYNYSNLAASSYYTGGNVSVRVQHQGIGSSTDNVSGLYLDYLKFDSSVNTSVTSAAGIAMQGSIDNTYWFPVSANVSTFPSYTLLTNFTAKYIRFNISGITIGNESSNYLGINYLGVY